MADSKLLNTSTSASPPPNCAICLGSCSNKCFSDTCMHQFCFNCLLQWSKIKAECPLCKQPFKSIIHNVKSNEEYEEHIVEQPVSLPVRIMEDFIYPRSSPRQHRFHFRTTFTVNTHGENAIQRMLMSHSLTNGITISDYLPHSNPYIERTRRRPRCTSTSYRRAIYESNLWASMHNNPSSMTIRFREITPEFFRANPNSRARLVPWLNRELNALLHENTQDVMQVVDIIMDYLLRYHICTRPFRNLLRTYLGARTDHFVHEFYNFLRSPFDMIGYDRHVDYYERPTTPTPFVDISEDDSDVVIVEENPEVIEVLSSDSDDDVIMTSSFVPKPKLITEGSSSRRSRRVSVSSSTSNEELRREQERPRKPKRKRSTREEFDNRRVSRLPDSNSDEDSSSSVLDDVPLSKYLRIEASIGKKLSKRSSNMVNAQPTQKPREANRPNSHSRKEGLNKKTKQPVATTSSLSKAHCSRYSSQRTDSSSSSSSDSCSSYPSQEYERRHRRNCNKSTSSSSSHTIMYKSSVPKLEVEENRPPYCIKSGTERMQEIYLDMHRRGSTSPGEGPSNVPSPYLPREQFVSQSVVDGRKDDIATSNSEPEVLGFRQTSATNQGVKPRKEGMNRFRPQYLAEEFITQYSANQASSSTSASSSNAYIPSSSRNYQPYSSYNTDTSPDLIDLSVKSRIRHEKPLTVSCVPPEIRARFRESSPRFYSRCAAEAHSPDLSLPSTSYAHYSCDRLPSNIFKSEPSYSEYQSEGSTKYWTDLSTQNTSQTNSNDSSYNYQGQQPRRSVIQNSRDNSVPQNEIISPRWSVSNSPSYPCYPENWSDNSD